MIRDYFTIGDDAKQCEKKRRKGKKNTQWNRDGSDDNRDKFDRLTRLLLPPQSFQTAPDPIRIYDLIYNKRATMEIVSGHLSSVPYINLSIAPNTTTTTTTTILSRITINV